MTNKLQVSTRSQLCPQKLMCERTCVDFSSGPETVIPCSSLRYSGERHHENRIERPDVLTLIAGVAAWPMLVRAAERAEEVRCPPYRRIMRGQLQLAEVAWLPYRVLPQASLRSDDQTAGSGR